MILKIILCFLLVVSIILAVLNYFAFRKNLRSVAQELDLSEKILGLQDFMGIQGFSRKIWAKTG